MQITIKVPTIKSLTSLINKVEAKFTTSERPVLDYGCYRNDQNEWFSYWVLNDMCYVEPTPEGINSKAYAQTRLGHTDAPESYNCSCDKCKSTGQIYGGKCYSCDGKGWISPIDLSRAKKYQAKQAAKSA